MIAPAAVFFVGVLVWHLAVTTFDVPPFLVPSPAAVALEAWRNAGELATATAITAAAAATGLAASLVLGILVGAMFARWRVVARSFYPWAIFLQTVPIVAIAPLIVIWFGPGFRSIVLVTILVAIFPIITAATAGLTTIDAELVDLFRVAGATGWQQLWKLRLPNAVPHLVAGAQAAGGLAVVGAIAGEVFAGYGASAHGLGYLVLVTSGQLKTAYLFAAVTACTILGLVAFGTLAGVGRTMTRHWREPV